MKSFLTALCSLMLLTATVLADGMSERLDTAISMLEAKQGSSRPIPQKILDRAKGIALIEISRGGIVFGGSHGEGIVLARTKTLFGHDWSAPSAFNMSGGSFGAQIGFETKRFIFVLNNDEALALFSSDSAVNWEAAAAATAGPDHVSEESSKITDAPIYVYSRSDGAFAGATVGGTNISTAVDVNHGSYGYKTLTKDILGGKVKPPKGSQQLYQLLKGR